MDPLLELADVSVRLGGRTVLDHVSHSISRGRLTVVVGPNGAGKSTMLRVLTGELRPATGCASWAGAPIDTLAPDYLASRRAVVPQGAVLAFPFQVREVVALGATVPGFGLPEPRQPIERAMREADIAHLSTRSYTQLSGGERQRVQFARALCQLYASRVEAEETALLLDEPTSNLDLPHQIHLMRCARAQARMGRTVVAVIHDLNLAAAWADDVMAIGSGDIAFSGAPRHVLTAANLERAYGTRIHVARLPGVALPVVLPHESSQ